MISDSTLQPIYNVTPFDVIVISCYVYLNFWYMIEKAKNQKLFFYIYKYYSDWVCTAVE